MSADKEFTYSDVSEHNTKKDLYIVVHDKVYNASSFVDEHPGGEEVLLDVGGQDSTEAFEDVGHSDEAREILEGLLVGKLKRQVRLSHSPSRTPLFPTRSCILRSLPRITLRTLGFVAGDGDLASGIPRGVLDTISE
ncbi:hypothetical protein ACJQWK_01579 [Exserohilum turcicum]